ncbi:hypothetical protein LguiA_001754 [Lonicera macranthoides]
MADKYGPIFTFKLGIHQVLVVSDSNLAKECLTTNDKAFANRPKSVAVELMGYNYAMFGLGKRYSSEDEQGLKDSQKVLRDFLVLLGIFVVADAIPWLRWLDFGAHEKVMKETFMEIDYILQG